MTASQWDQDVAIKVLRDRFGHSSFRGKQQHIVRTLIEGNDALVVQATGSGKSLCFQFVPCYLRQLAASRGKLHVRSVGLIISPLISLIDDQVIGLRARGVNAVAVHGSAQDATALSVASAELIYTTPESVVATLRLVPAESVTVIAIDESHCISDWGHDFRPAYKSLSGVRNSCPHAAVVALTATAPRHVRDDIMSSLQLRSPRVFLSTSNRPNLHFRTRLKRGLDDDIAHVLKHCNLNEESTIIYCIARSETENIANCLRRACPRLAVAAYHAGLNPERRRAVHEQFLEDEIRVVVATIAFGMGIDKPDIRNVIHLSPPSSMEAYVQQMGRAGRDGLPARCILMHSSGDWSKHHYLIGQSAAEHVQQTRLDLMTAMQRYATGRECRRATLVQYFDKENANNSRTGSSSAASTCEGIPIDLSFTHPDGCCDMCTAKDARARGEGPGAVDLTRQFRMIVQAINFAPMVGASMIIDLVKGSSSKRILDRWTPQQLRKLPSYGQGEGFSTSYWKAIITLMSQQRLIQTVSRSGANKFSWTGYQLLPAGIVLANSTIVVHPPVSIPPDLVSIIRPQARSRASASTPGTPSGTSGGGESSQAPSQVKATLSAAESQLYDRLEALRRRLARTHRIPPYSVVHTQDLTRIVSVRPGTIEGLRDTTSLTTTQLHSFGPKLVAEVRAACEILSLTLFEHQDATAQRQGVDRSAVLLQSTPRAVIGALAMRKTQSMTGPGGSLGGAADRGPTTSTPGSTPAHPVKHESGGGLVRSQSLNGISSQASVGAGDVKPKKRKLPWERPVSRPQLAMGTSQHPATYAPAHGGGGMGAGGAGDPLGSSQASTQEHIVTPMKHEASPGVVSGASPHCISTPKKAAAAVTSNSVVAAFRGVGREPLTAGEVHAYLCGAAGGGGSVRLADVVGVLSDMECDMQAYAVGSGRYMLS